MMVGSRDVRVVIDLAVREGKGGLGGGASPGSGAQGTKDGPLGVGPMPVLSEPLGSSISDHGSAGSARCRDRILAPVVHRTQVGQTAVHRFCFRPTHSAPNPQPNGMTSKKSARRRRRRRSPQPRLKVRHPDELLAIIPYLIGFHPAESIVAVFVRSGRIVLTARMDLPPEVAIDQLAERIDALAEQQNAQALALVAYSQASLPANRMLTRLMDRLSSHELTDVLYVGHGRWWSLSCGEECCPLTGTPYDLSSHPVSAAAVVAGLSARADRRELEATVSGPPETELPRLDALAATLFTELGPFDNRTAAARLMISIVDAGMADPCALDERSCLLLGWLVTDFHIRDLAWSRISHAEAEDHVQLWGSVVARVPPLLAAAPLCLLGMAAWVSGAGALLNCCCERLSRVNPAYSMGGLLATISEQAIPPSFWHQIRDEMQAELGAQAALQAG
jgi:hypothetical protein